MMDMMSGPMMVAMMGVGGLLLILAFAVLVHKKYRVVGLDRHSPPHPPHQAECICFDITDKGSVDKALARLWLAYGDRSRPVFTLPRPST